MSKATRLESRPRELIIPVNVPVISDLLLETEVTVHLMMISLRLRTNYVIRVMRIKDKGGRTKFKYYK